jgi:NADH-quinone oxidoreductase subunit N
MNAFYVICGLGVFSLLAEIINLKRWLIAIVTIGMAAVVLLAARDWNTSLSYYHDMVVFDNFAIAITALIAVLGVLWFWMASRYFHDETHLTDQAALVLFSISGGILMASFNNMAMLFLGIEILSISLYVLAGSRKLSLSSNEAAFKYFLMGSFATGFLLMGIALIYGATASFRLDVIAAYIAQHPTGVPGFFYVGVLLMLVGMAFKVSAVPFHFWAPDVYEGSPTPITAFMSTIVKVAAFAAFFRLFAFTFQGVQEVWLTALQVITVLTLVLANIAAVYQNSVKRMLAYSSVGHAGYVLLGITSGGLASSGVIFYYLAVYSFASLSAFAVLYMEEGKGYDVTVDRFNGLFKKNPFVAVALTISLLSLAGIPPLAGFFGKYLVFSLALAKGYTGMVLLAVVTSLIGVYYYFKVIIAMYMKEPVGQEEKPSTSMKLWMIILIALNLILGIFPDLASFLH